MLLKSYLSLGCPHASSVAVIGEFADDEGLEHSLLRPDAGIEACFRIGDTTLTARTHLIAIEADIDRLIPVRALERAQILSVKPRTRLLPLNSQGLFKGLHHL